MSWGNAWGTRTWGGGAGSYLSTTIALPGTVMGLGAVQTPEAVINHRHPVTFSYTGAPQDFVVPAGVTTITVDCQGAAGGDHLFGNYYVGGPIQRGGLGGRTECSLTVTPGETLHVYVGGIGTMGFSGLPSGYNGGGISNNAAGGGGASDIRQGGTSLADRVVVAGGGGGAGSQFSGANGGSGGAGGGGNGSAGFPADAGTGAGGGGTNTAGGAGGTGGSIADGDPGTLGNGGSATGSITGGGGGGGYYGGGGGASSFSPPGGGGGGGGSGLGTGSLQTLTSGFRAGDGIVTLAWIEPGWSPSSGVSGSGAVQAPVGRAVESPTTVGGTGTVYGSAHATNPVSPVTATHLTTFRHQGTFVTSVATSSITPTAEALVLCLVKFWTGATISVSGCGLTWVQVAYSETSPGSEGMALFRARGSAPTPGAVTVDFNGTNQFGCQVVIDQFTGVDRSGTNGSGAIVQSVTAATTSVSTMTVTLSAFANQRNVTYGGFSQGGTLSLSPGSGFTTLGADSGSTPSSCILSEWKSANDTTVDVSSSGTATTYGIAVEIAGEYVPESIPGVAEVWIADDIAQSDGSSVSAWIGRVASRTLAQASSSKQPLYRTSGIGGQPAVDFDGSDDLMVFSALNAVSAATSGHVFVVVMRDGGVGGNNDVISSSMEGTTNKYLEMRVGGDDKLYMIGDSGSDAWFENAIPDTTALATPYLFEWASNGSSHSERINGISQTSNGFSGTPAGKWFAHATRNNFAVGGRKDTTERFFFNGKIAAVIVVDGVMGSGDRQSFYEWVDSKYRIWLPGTPYYASTLAGTGAVQAPRVMNPATVMGAGAVQSLAPAPLTVTFSYTGAAQTFTVPSGVTTITVDAYGAQAGMNGAGLPGGGGGRTKCDLTVTPGETLQLNVGGQGGNFNGVAGWNGGGSAYSGGVGGAGGGGGSDVRRGSYALTDRLVVAGGGGGYGNNSSGADGGVGGGGNGTAGTATNQNSDPVTGGAGGTSSAGGAGGVGAGGTGGAGSLGQGGNVLQLVGESGGGGGGGYYGGGAGGTANTGGGPHGAGSGGGGGSGLSTGVNETLAQGTRSGNGQIIVTYTFTPGPALVAKPTTVTGVGSVQGALRTPESIPGMVEVWIADDIAQSDGSSVSAWVGRIGGRSLAQATSSKRPLYRTSAIGGQPAVDFDGSDDNLHTAVSVSTASSGHVFIVARFDSLSAGGCLYFADGPSDDFFYEINNWGTGSTDFLTGGSNYWFKAPNSALVTSTNYLLEVNSSGSSWSMRINGTAQSISDVFGGHPNAGFWFDGLGASPVVHVGTSPSGISQLDAKIAAIFVVDGSLSTQDRDALNLWIQSKYGISLGATGGPSTETEVAAPSTVSGTGTIQVPARVDIPTPSTVLGTGSVQDPVLKVYRTFGATGASVDFVVPPFVTSIDFDIYGAAGGDSGDGQSGGLGGRLQATLDVTPGETLKIYVGDSSSLFNGGGYAGDVGVAGVGGGASDVRQGGNALSDRKLVAGGGGGASYWNSGVNNGPGGAGGGTTGQTGQAVGTGSGAVAGNDRNGGGGTPSAGGAAGVSQAGWAAVAGSLGQGGDSAYVSHGISGGGGGGGYYGGGGGGVQNTDPPFLTGGGGGGSSYADPAATSVIHTQGARAGDGVITISYLLIPVPGDSTIAGTGVVQTAQPAAPPPVSTVTGIGQAYDPASIVFEYYTNPSTVNGVGTTNVPSIVMSPITPTTVSGAGTVGAAAVVTYLPVSSLHGSGHISHLTLVEVVFVAGVSSIVTQASASPPSFELMLESWTAEGTQGAVVTTSAFGALTADIPPVPFPSPGNWKADATEDVTAGATALPVEPLTVNMPTGAVIFFPDATVILTQAANPGDTTLYIRPLSGTVDSGHHGSGGAPAPGAPGVGQPPAAPHWGPWDEFSPLRRTSLRYPKPVLNADGMPT